MIPLLDLESKELLNSWKPWVMSIANSKSLDAPILDIGLLDCLDCDLIVLISESLESSKKSHSRPQGPFEIPVYPGSVSFGYWND